MALPNRQTNCQFRFRFPKEKSRRLFEAVKTLAQGWSDALREPLRASGVDSWRLKIKEPQP